MIPLPSSIESAHEELWRRFILPDGNFLDYSELNGTVFLPEPGECRRGFPNALSWCTPLSNSTFFSGLYLASLLKRYQRSAESDLIPKVKVLVHGLLRAARVSAVPGFVARGIASDGVSHYPCGSDDQTHPWFFGLFAYVESGIPSKSERTEIIDQMSTVARALLLNGWRCPCDGMFIGFSRGDFLPSSMDFRSVTRYLFILKIMAELTRDQEWKQAYQSASLGAPAGEALKRGKICREGYMRDLSLLPGLAAGSSLWITAGSVASLSRLAALEEDLDLLDDYRQGERIRDQ